MRRVVGMTRGTGQSIGAHLFLPLVRVLRRGANIEISSRNRRRYRRKHRRVAAGRGEGAIGPS